MAEENKESQGGSIFGNLIKTIIVGDLKSTGQWVYNQIVKPRTQNAIEDIIVQGSHYLVHGSPAPAQTQQGQKAMTYTDYWKQKNAQATQQTATAVPANGQWVPQPANTNQAQFNLIFRNDQNQAASDLHQLQLKLQSSRYVTVGDYYRVSSRTDLANANFTTEHYGWTNLDGAYIYTVNGKWAIGFPSSPIRVVALNL